MLQVELPQSLGEPFGVTCQDLRGLGVRGDEVFHPTVDPLEGDIRIGPDAEVPTFLVVAGLAQLDWHPETLELAAQAYQGPRRGNLAAERRCPLTFHSKVPRPHAGGD